jgi:uncharacterized protein (DUF58 family)
VSTGAARSDEGVYVSLDELARLQFVARDVSFLPRQPIHSLLSGRHASRLRGRGLDFAELRGYLPGDDPRTIDWKVTARTGSPHVRVYTEERDRPALLIVDQRISMFFGSVRSMKSVAAARIAAAAAWRVTGAGDRVGAMVFDDTRAREVPPHRSRETVLRILHDLVDMNGALRADSDVRPAPTMLNQVLTTADRLAKHDYLVAIVSDFDGLDDETTRLISRMAQRNDVLAFPVFDPTGQDLPERGRLVVSDGELQMELDLGRGGSRKRLLDLARGRLERVLAWQSDLGVPVLPISCGEDELQQIRRLLGQASSRRPASAGSTSSP